MLDELGAAPDVTRERKMRLIGRTIGLLCHIGGWFVPMYGAGRLESGNVGEYEQAARLATRAGHHHYVERLLVMAEVEWDHEKYFRTKVQGHLLSRVVPLWKTPAPREEIRRSFLEFARSDERALTPPSQIADAGFLGLESVHEVSEDKVENAAFSERCKPS